MSLWLYNTLSRELEEFAPATPGYVGIYVCGPTVYSDAHLGHAKAQVTFDLLRRWLLHQGLKVRYVSNVTDVGHLSEVEEEDKIARRAKLERLEPMEVADKYFWRYFQDMGNLNVKVPDITPRATGHIVEQIELVEDLLGRGIAYEKEGSVYFRATGFPDYGKLSGKNLDELVSGARVSVREEKEDPRDWALWKKAEPEHLMRWKSPWGEGFPGWHLECTVMSLKYLGEGFDIHGGGIDLQFPHHDCEIAQAEAAGHRFARFWLHNNHLLLNGEKMAKSTGNFITLREVLAEHEPMALRLYLLQSHYRSVTNFTFEALEAAEKGYQRLRAAYQELKGGLEVATPGPDPNLESALDKLEADFSAAMNDDLNSPQALAALFAFLPALHQAQAKKDSLQRAAQVFQTLGEDVLGLFPAGALQNLGLADALDGTVKIVLELREEARRERDFARSDQLRSQLRQAGVALEDTPAGPRWRLAEE